MNEVFEST